MRWFKVVTWPMLIPIPQGIQDTYIRASRAHSRIGDPKPHQSTARTWAYAGGVWGPRSRSASEGAGDT